jgi:hypothetical protein
LAEVDDRRLHLKAGYNSLFAYCVAVHGMSEDEACRRIEVARLGLRGTRSNRAVIPKAGCAIGHSQAAGISRRRCDCAGGACPASCSPIPRDLVAR